MPFKPAFWAAARLSLLMLAGMGLSAGASAQGYPSRPVRLSTTTLWPQLSLRRLPT